MTVFFIGGKARTADFNAGDVGLVPRTFGHYVENTGDTDLVYPQVNDSREIVRVQDLVPGVLPEPIPGDAGVLVPAHVVVVNVAIRPADQTICGIASALRDRRRLLLGQLFGGHVHDHPVHLRGRSARRVREQKGLFWLDTVATAWQRRRRIGPAELRDAAKRPRQSPGR